MRQWAVRITHEAQTHPRNSFLTLTLDDEHMPKCGTLNKRLWQLFAKRLRHDIGPFRYYHCGEYSPKTGRAHYHAAIFGEDWDQADRYFYRMSKCGKFRIYRSPSLEEAWGQGQVFIGTLTFDSASYIAGYIMKKITGFEASHERYGTRIQLDPGEAGTIHAKLGHILQPEYTTMSLKPGIGEKWIEKYISDVYPADEVIINGKRTRPPPFYDKYCEDNHPKLWESVRGKRLATDPNAVHPLDYTQLEISTTVLNSRTQNMTRE